jgi:PIN domain nuclease of toxin-antitoxin system
MSQYVTDTHALCWHLTGDPKLSAIPRADIPDMPDRIITATAYQLGFPLITKDEKIRNSRVVPVIW